LTAKIKDNIEVCLYRSHANYSSLKRRADLRSVQTLLGHAYVETTQIYTTVSTRKLNSIHGINIRERELKSNPGAGEIGVRSHKSL
jgi:site-specific recombinase XerD